MSIDYEHISHLFSIIEGCVNHTGKFGAIQNEAFNELGTINAQLHKAQMDRKAADEKQLKEHEARQPKLIEAKDERKATFEPEPQLDIRHRPVDEPQNGQIESGDTTTLAERRI